MLRTQPRLLVTPALIGLNVLVFGLMVAGGVSLFDPSVDALLDWGASFGPYELGDDWWRSVTSMFVHIGIIHLALNMWCLWTLGELAEPLWGRVHFAGIYLLCGLSGNLLSIAAEPMAASAGASGAVFGVAGCVLGAHWIRGVAVAALSRERAASVGSFVLYNLVVGSGPGIDVAAHLGGLLGGFALATLLPRPGDGGVAPLGLRSALVTLSATVGFAYGRAALARVYAPKVELAQGERLWEAGQRDSALVLWQRAAQRDSVYGPAQHALGYAYVEMERYEEAIPVLFRALHAGGSDGEVWHTLGIAYLGTDSVESAVTALAKAVEFGGEDRWRAQYNLGIVQSRARRFREAVAAFDGALQSNADSAAEAHLHRAAAYAELGRYAEARADYEWILSPHATIAPDSPMMEDARLGLERLERLRAARPPRR